MVAKKSCLLLENKIQGALADVWLAVATSSTGTVWNSRAEKTSVAAQDLERLPLVTVGCHGWDSRTDRSVFYLPQASQISA
jgi:hypothetical protein